MTRSITGLSVSFSLWLAMAGTASGQAALEYGLGAARAATTAAPAKSVGKSVSGLAGSLDKVLKAGQPSLDALPSAAATAMPAAKAPSTSADTAPAPVVKREDPSGIEAGLSSDELFRRFGPPAMAITVEAERSLTYSGKDGVFQVKVQDGVVKSIEKPQP